MQKTNAMRMLDKEKIEYQIYEYDSNLTNGELVAESLGENKAQVFKTLVTQANTKEYFVFVVPVAETLDLKKAAKVAGVKDVQMLPQKELLPLTGYIHGGCSPVGMKKQFKTFINESASYYDKIFVSGGRVGVQIKISPYDLQKMTKCEFIDLIIFKENG
jgi:Cys-tRNA(Pro)/Cys-tRNA(Cys) deacylase